MNLGCRAESFLECFLLLIFVFFNNDEHGWSQKLANLAPGFQKSESGVDQKRLGQTKLSPTIGSGVRFIISDAAMVCKENCHRMY